MCSLSSDEAAVVAAEAHDILQALKASKKRKSKKSTVKETKEPNITAKIENSTKDGGVSEPKPEPETSTAKDKGKTHETNESDTGDSNHESTNKKSVQNKPSGKIAIPSGDDLSFSSSSHEDDLSLTRKERIRGRTPGIKSSGKLSKKLFNMESPAKYTGEKD